MTEANFYTGLSFHWAVQEIKRDIGGKSITSRPPLPQKYLGEVGSGKGKAGSASVDTTDLDLLVVANATGKDEKELKSWAIRDANIKANDAYIKGVISGKKLTELEASGSLVKDPETGKYL